MVVERLSVSVIIEHERKMIMRNDADLLELGGYWIYTLDELNVGDYLPVNDKEDGYLILDIQVDNPQAMTVVNATTKEATVVFQGTDFGDLSDVSVDALLALGLEHDQFQGVEQYYEKAKEAVAEYNIIHAVEDTVKEVILAYTAGNSLGGAFANYLATIENNLFAVTLDPAPLPSKIDMSETQALNYIAETSPLYLLCLAAGFVPDSFPGDFAHVDFSNFSFANIAKNHTGYDRSVAAGVGIDDLISFSIWDNKILTPGATGTPIELNVETLNQLAQVLNGRMEQVKTELLKYLEPAYDIITSEKSNLFNRQEGLLTTIESLLMSTINDFLGVEDHLRNINTVLAFLDGETFSIPPIDLTQIKNTITNKITPLFTDEHSGYNDAFAEKLARHQQIINDNLGIVIEKWDYVTKSTDVIAKTFSDMDTNIASRIATKSASGATSKLPKIERTGRRVKDSASFTDVRYAIEAKEEQVNNNFEGFKKAVVMFLTPILDSLVIAVATAEKMIELTKAKHNMAFNTAKWSWQTIITGAETSELKTSYQQIWQNKELEHADTLNELERIATIAIELKNLLSKHRMIIPEALDQFKPYLTEAIFKTSKFDELQRNLYTSLGLVQNANLIFTEIWQRIEINKNQAITELRTEAKSTSTALDHLSEQIRVIVG